MTNQNEKRQRRGALRFWLPFAAVALVFTGLALAYGSDERAREPAPGAVRRAPAADEQSSHGLEPESQPSR